LSPIFPLNPILICHMFRSFPCCSYHRGFACQLPLLPAFIFLYDPAPPPFPFFKCPPLLVRFLFFSLRFQLTCSRTSQRSKQTFPLLLTTDSCFLSPLCWVLFPKVFSTTNFMPLFFFLFLPVIPSGVFYLPVPLICPTPPLLFLNLSPPLWGHPVDFLPLRCTPIFFTPDVDFPLFCSNKDFPPFPPFLWHFLVFPLSYKYLPVFFETAFSISYHRFDKNPGSFGSVG